MVHRERVRSFVRVNWRVLLTLTLGMLLVFGLLARWVDGRFTQGFVVGLGLALTASVVAGLSFVMSGAATAYMGEVAEQWTAAGLRPLTKHGWQVLHNVVLRYGDADHVAVGPGGVVVVESKWSGHGWSLTADKAWIDKAVRQATRAAERVGGICAVDAHPVVVLHGERRDDTLAAPVRVEVDGHAVTVLHGRDVETWALRRGRDRLTAADVERVVEQLTSHSLVREEREKRSRRMPMGVDEIAQRVIGCVTAAALGPMAVGSAAAFGTTGLVGSTLGTLVLGIVGMRAHQTRHFAISLLLGVVALWVWVIVHVLIVLR